MRIYVGNLCMARTTEAEVRELFAGFGSVRRLLFKTDYDGKPRGFAFVDMADTDGRAAISGLDGFVLHGRRLTVNEARARDEVRRIN